MNNKKQNGIPVQEYELINISMQDVEGGTANVMCELYNRLKAQVEEEANESVKHISEIMETCRLHDEVTGEETDEYKYYKWLTGAHCGTYRTIADKALAEALAWIFEAAYRKCKGHIIAMNNDGVLIETVIAATPTETPQISTETAKTVNVSVEGESVVKSREMQSREDVIAYLDKMHGVEYDAGEVVYLKDGYVAEEHTDEIEWCIYRNEDSDKCIETVRIAPQSPENSQTA